ncbi:MAG: DUF3500 domain-containing protein [Planctomycetota bacterium]
MRRFIFPLAAILVLPLTLALRKTEPAGVQLRKSAGAFLDTLNDEQRRDVLFEYAAKERTAWHFIPKDDRKGMPLSKMDDAQRAAALRLVRAGLSQIGYEKTRRVRLAEAIVAKLEGKGRRWPRDPELYYVTLFGKPTDDASQEPWALSFEGHHISLNFVIRGDQVVDSTPQFFGAHPARIPKGYDGNWAWGDRVLPEEEDLGFKLIGSMGSSDRKLAIFAEKAPKEVRFAGDAQAAVDAEAVGIAWGELNRDQQETLKQLVLTYTDVAAPEVAKARRKRIEQDGWETLHFGWAGAVEPGTGHYYRIRAPSFLIELVNTQPDAMGNPANHMHCFFRDLTGDFDLPPAEPSAQ